MTCAETNSDCRVEASSEQAVPAAVCCPWPAPAHTTMLYGPHLTTTSPVLWHTAVRSQLALPNTLRSSSTGRRLHTPMHRVCKAQEPNWHATRARSTSRSNCDKPSIASSGSCLMKGPERSESNASVQPPMQHFRSHSAVNRWLLCLLATPVCRPALAWGQTTY